MNLALKTRKVSSESDWTCPVHKHRVSKKVLYMTMKNGQRKYMGNNFACAEFDECGYYVNGKLHVPII